MRFSQNVQDALCDFNISPRITSAYVVDSARAAGLQDLQNRPAMILDIDPVTHVRAITINGYGLVFHRVCQHERKIFLGELSWAIVIPAAGCYYIQPESVVGRANEMFGGCF